MSVVQFLRISDFVRTHMIQITLSDEQALALANSTPPVVVVNSLGNALGQITPIDQESVVRAMMSPERWEELQRRMNEPGEYITLDEIKQRLGW
jgi:hypothetical protein